MNFESMKETDEDINGLLQGLIFVVDSNDRERSEESAEVLSNLLQEDELRDAVLLVFANNQDLPNAMGWYIQATSANQETGLYEGLYWLSNELSRH